MEFKHKFWDFDRSCYFVFAPCVYSFNKEEGFSFGLELFGCRLFYFSFMVKK